MANRKQVSIGDTRAISVRDAIYIGGLLLSMGTMYGIIGNRVSTMEGKLAESNARYEREVVPRAEHLQMNAVLEQRLLAIIDAQREDSAQIKQMQIKLDSLVARPVK